MSESFTKGVQAYISTIILGQALEGSSEYIKKLILQVDPLTTIKQIISIIRTQMKISPNESLFIYAYGRTLNGDDTIGKIYKECEKKLDGAMLELKFAGMNSFGVGLKMEE